VTLRHVVIGFTRSEETFWRHIQFTIRPRSTDHWRSKIGILTPSTVTQCYIQQERNLPFPVVFNEAVPHECTSRQHWLNGTDRGKVKVPRKHHTDWPGIESGPRDERPTTNGFSRGTATLLTQKRYVDQFSGQIWHGNSGDRVARSASLLGLKWSLKFRIQSKEARQKTGSFS
jgi:hypothetical protein